MIEDDYDPLDDLDSLDYAFELPPGLLKGLSDQAAGKMRHLYEVLISRMRKEAAHLPMYTAQQMLLSRLTTGFVTMIALEQSASPDPRDVHTRTQTWLAIQKAFNDLLIKTQAAAEREAYAKKLSRTLAGVLMEADLSDETREALVRDLAHAIEQAAL